MGCAGVRWGLQGGPRLPYGFRRAGWAGEQPVPGLGTSLLALASAWQPLLMLEARAGSFPSTGACSCLSQERMGACSCLSREGAGSPGAGSSGSTAREGRKMQGKCESEQCRGSRVGGKALSGQPRLALQVGL